MPVAAHRSGDSLHTPLAQISSTRLWWHQQTHSKSSINHYRAACTFKPTFLHQWVPYLQPRKRSQKVLTKLCLKTSSWWPYRLGNTPIPCRQRTNIDKDAVWKRKAQQMGFHWGLCSEHAYGPIKRSSWKLRVCLEAIHSGIRLSAPWLARPVIQPE